MTRRMKFTTLGATIIAALAGFVATPATSRAADLSAPYNPGILGDQRTEFATGWYIRGDVGYEQASVNALSTGAAVAFGAPPVMFDPSANRQNSYVLTLGGGYKLNNWFRFRCHRRYPQRPLWRQVQRRAAVPDRLHRKPDGDGRDAGLFGRRLHAAFDLVADAL